MSETTRRGFFARLLSLSAAAVVVKSPSDVLKPPPVTTGGVTGTTVMAAPQPMMVSVWGYPGASSSYIVGHFTEKNIGRHNENLTVADGRD
jgi:hypothetical protein